MRENVRRDILNILKEAVSLLKSENIDASRLREISNHTIHDASIFQDSDSISNAVVVYAASKMIENDDSVAAKLAPLFEDAYRYLRQEDIYAYRKTVKRMLKTIKRLSEKEEGLKGFINDTLTKARINKGGRMVYHGVSLARTAKLLGLSRWELMSYIGSKSEDEEEDAREEKQRFEESEDIFGLRR